ncbi:hypothetical protein ACO0LB_02935 [Undibacterium sp. SXout7W]|uniref:hypothetical protein n=1 Tax=Undibacterium sp. SXout7W TaxID=3413049 RepID=UPI003BF3F49D
MSDHRIIEIALRRLNTSDADKLIENVGDDDRNVDLDGILMMKMTAGWHEIRVHPAVIRLFN